MLSLRTIAAFSMLGLAAVLWIGRSPLSVPGYLAGQARGQLEMLYGRMPVESARDRGLIAPEQERSLARVDDILAFADELGLTVGDRYTIIHPSWDKRILNVSACQPLSFRTVRWQFPVVGRVPYLGFFEPEPAWRAAQQLERQGLDVYVRPAGAYSMLGWLDDPLLPHMLKWSEARLAGTLLHELTHATVWVPGSVRFNESLANFVGNEAALRYLIDRHGPDSDEVSRELASRNDRALYKAMLREVHTELALLYSHPRKSTGEKLRDKAAILASLPQRASQLPFSRRQAWVRGIQRYPWNNARLAQYRTYNDSEERFRKLLRLEGDDLMAFLTRVSTFERGKDPFEALDQAIGAR